MASYIVYRSQKLTSLLLKYSPDAEFRTVVDNFSEISWPSLPINPELISFALLELVSNSIRAHREKGITEPVRVDLRTDSQELRASVIDAGRGFDPSVLPYDITAGVETVNVMGDAFTAYRDMHEGRRFGMGLYVARKTFRRFNLYFVDSQENPCPWFSGKVKGTRIDLALPIVAAPLSASIPVHASAQTRADYAEVEELPGPEGFEDA
jgi:anti-sigma regulatory factor (Ser/Thr protein kinase)